MRARMRTFFVLFVVCWLQGCGPDGAAPGNGNAAGGPSVGRSLQASSSDVPTPFETDPLDGLAFQGSERAMVWPGGAQHLRFVVDGRRFFTVVVDATGRGTWTFTTHAGISGADACYGDVPTLLVGTYWRDASVPDDPWHFWPGGGLVCWPFPIFGTDVYAGGKGIEFAFVYGNWSETPVVIYADLVPKNP